MIKVFIKNMNKIYINLGRSSMIIDLQEILSYIIDNAKHSF